MWIEVKFVSAAGQPAGGQRTYEPIVSNGDIYGKASLNRQGVINFIEIGGDRGMAVKSPPKRDTFRHGNLRQALVDAALQRLEAEGIEAISLRELARDAGVNHRAVYRHFPDKLSLLAAVAESGWKRLGQRLAKSVAGKAPGEPALIAGGVGLFLTARDCPNLFHLMAGERINTEGKFPDLEAAIVDALQIFAVGFAGTGMAPNIVVERTAVFVAALQGVVTQMLHHRLHVAPTKARTFVADTCRMLIKGMQ
jgi:AcrR family transcriptional regulator